MAKVMGAILLAVALGLAAVFLLTGAGLPAADPSPLPEQLAHLAGSPLLAGGAGVAFFLAVVLLGTRTRKDPGFANTEVVQLLCAGAGVAFSVALVLGVSRVWSLGVLAGLALGGGAVTLVAVGLGIRLATSSHKRLLLFVPGILGAAALAVFYLVLFVLGVS